MCVQLKQPTISYDPLVFTVKEHVLYNCLPILWGKRDSTLKEEKVWCTFLLSGKGGGERTQ